MSTGGLDPGSTFAGVIYSVNAKGKGELLSISAVTIQDQAEKRTGQSSDDTVGFFMCHEH